MHVNVINNVPDIDVNVDNAGNSLSITITPKSGKCLKDYKPGEIAKIGNREYIVLEHKDVFMTAVLDRDIAAQIAFGENANWVGSDVESYCEGKYYKELAKVVGEENIISHTVDLMCDDGSNKGVVSKNNISILTMDNYRRYREYIPSIGRALWTTTRVTVLDNNYTRGVCIINSYGVPYWDNCGYSYGVRPFCILNSNVLTS